MTWEQLYPMLNTTVIIAVSTLLYAVLMQVKFRHLPEIAIGAGMTYLIFALLDHFGMSLLLSNAVAALAATIYGETMARIKKAPVSVYSIPSIIPLVPGGSLYYTMAALVNEDNAEFVRCGSNTLTTSLGIAIGIISVSVIAVFLPRPGFQRR